MSIIKNQRYINKKHKKGYVGYQHGISVAKKGSKETIEAHYRGLIRATMSI